MKISRLKSQAGYVLLLMLVALMGGAGIVVAGFAQEARQQAEHERFLHNQRVLEEAKQALLMYAYNYALNNPGRGPGRLPCPDTSNSGTPNATFNCENVTGVVGRFPWNDPDMGLTDLRDASGERLWYAVSRNFANTISPVAADVINSDTTGTITIHDQTGATRYDNSIEGIAAVIIAPGPEIDRNGVAQNRAADINDPANFLDQFGALDNSNFDNTIPSTDGFVMGPIFNTNGDVIVNDQMILVTTAEVTAMAEKAVLEAYRDAIDDYQQNIWGAAVANYRYPWPNAYADITNLTIYDVVPGTTVGRVPYLNYYTDHNSHTVITDLSITYDITFDLTGTGGSDPDNMIPTFNTALAGGVTVNLADANLSFSQVSRPGLVDDPSDDFGALVSTAGITDNTFIDRFFWDGCATCPQPQDGWELCPVVVGDETDCARDAAGTAFVPFTNWTNHADQRIRIVRLQFAVDAVFEIGLDFDPAPTWDPTIIAPTGGTNARREAVINPILITELLVDVPASPADDFVEISVALCEQDNNVGSSFNAFYLGNSDAGSAFCATVPTLANASSVINQLDITADYYPELPLWVHENFWNDSILMAYADDYKPGPTDNDCLTPGNTCLTVIDDYDNRLDGLVNRKLLLLGASSIPAVPADLLTIFEGENTTPLDNVFAAHPQNGDDVMLVLDEI